MESLSLSRTLIPFLSFSLALVAMLPQTLSLPSTGGCRFPAIFNFGDSNSNTGCNSAVFGDVASPNGVTFFHKPSGRCCDGRVIIDFITVKFGLPYLSAYVDSIGTNFRSGANFAAGGATVLALDGKKFDQGFNPITLGIQLLQFMQFKNRTLELYSHGNESSKLEFRSRYPGPEDFSNALYIIDGGQNDLHAGLLSMTEDKVRALIPEMIDQFAQAVEQLYKEGARSFWVQNTGPLGCLPYLVIYAPPKPGNLDQNGCIRSFNELAQEFNMQLKKRMIHMRGQLLDAAITNVDIYSAKYSLISDAEKYGFTDPLGYCCGHFGDYKVICGKKAIVNGTEVSGRACSNPSNYISWDATHYTEAANQWITNHILTGSFSDPPLFIKDAC